MPALVAGIHDFKNIMDSKSWMPDTKSGMTRVDVMYFHFKSLRSKKTAAFQPPFPV